jgi:hypothetical protein
MKKSRVENLVQFSLKHPPTGTTKKVNKRKTSKTRGKWASKSFKIRGEGVSSNKYCNNIENSSRGRQEGC